MPAIKETVLTASGMSFVRKLFTKSRRLEGGRHKKSEPTVESVEKINQRNSLREMTIKVHHNFKPKDHFLTLTYEGDAPTKEYAKKALKAYIDQIRRKRKKAGQEFKWLAITEYENKRIHHHMIVNNVEDYSDLTSLWKNGLVRATPMEDKGDWRKLCEYMHKETTKTFRDPDAPCRLRYSCSRNLVMPPVYREEISAAEFFEEPEAEKGYHIDQDSVFRGENPFTGMPYIEYVMIPLDKPRTRYYKKQKVKYKTEKHDGWLRTRERQLEMDYPF